MCFHPTVGMKSQTQHLDWKCVEEIIDEICFKVVNSIWPTYLTYRQTYFIVLFSLSVCITVKKDNYLSGKR